MSRARQFEMFPKPPRPRFWLMHVCDARYDTVATVQMKCQRCGFKSEWIECRSVTEAKRGKPCPKCNHPRTPPQ